MKKISYSELWCYDLFSFVGILFGIFGIIWSTQIFSFFIAFILGVIMYSLGNYFKWTVQHEEKKK